MGCTKSIFQGLEIENLFDRDASHIVTAFGKKWHPAGTREEYICTFSKFKWELLLKSLKVKHSLQKCEACYDNYFSFQQLFPEKPIYCREAVVSIDMEQATLEKALTRKVLQDLNHQYHNQFHQSFVDSVVVIL